MLLKAFAKFPAEAEIIGRILASYADLEISLLHCVSMARDDFNSTMKSMFRTRNIRQRVDVADALGRQPYHALGLGTDFERQSAPYGTASKFVINTHTAIGMMTFLDDSRS